MSSPLGDESGATVSLDADTKPFEKAFDGAHAYANKWSGKMEGTFSALASVTTGKLKGVFSAIESSADKSGAEIGGQLGTGIGAAVGLLGGPVGSLIGSKLGQYAGQSFAADFNFDGLMSGQSGAWDVFSDGGKKAFEMLSDFADKMLARISDGIDSIWNTVQEPLAKVADYIQKIGVEIGLVDEGTASWGDTIRNIEDVGVAVLANLAYGFGYLEGVFKVVGGYALEYIGIPLEKMIAKVLEGISTLIRGVNQLAEDVGIGKFEWADNAANKLDKMSEKLTKSLKDQQELATGLQNTDIEGNARRRSDQVTGRVAEGRDAAAAKAIEEAEAYLAEVDRRFEEWLNEPLEQSADKIAEAGASFEKSADAMIQGSKETANAITRAQSEMNARAAQGTNPADKAAAAAAETAKNTKAAADDLGTIRRLLGEAPTLLTA